MNGEAKCWGYNAVDLMEWTSLRPESAQYVGNDFGEIGFSLLSFPIPNEEVAIDIAMGFNHACIITNTYKLYCFGENYKKQLGASYYYSFRYINWGIQSSSSVYGGPYVVEIDGTLNHKNETNNYILPTDAIEVSAGSQFTLVRFANGAVKGFGYGLYGRNLNAESGYRDVEASFSIRAPYFGNTWKVKKWSSNSYSFGTTCLINDLDEVCCYGYYDYGCIDFGLLKPIDVSFGDSHGCVILNTHELRCFGTNDYGQLGTGDNITRHGYSINGEDLISVNLGNNNQLGAIDSCSGKSHTCVVLTNYKVKCFGDNTYYQTGLSEDTLFTVGDDLPYVNLGIHKALEVHCGDYFTCILFETNHTTCFGLNDDGQIGHGRVSQSIGSYAPLNLGAAIKKLSLGSNSGCAVLVNGDARCWGYNAVDLRESNTLRPESGQYVGNDFGEIGFHY